MNRRLIVLCGVWLLAACSQEAVMIEKMIINADGVALLGYDPVSYFQGKPKKGQVGQRYEYAGLQWQFSNAENLQVFAATPEHYIPQYGGHCALAMSMSEQNPGKPESWHIQDDKLYFHGGGLAKFFFKLFSGRRAKADVVWSQAK